MYEIIRNSGFRLTFKNGLTLSVQFNPAVNYVSNKTTRLHSNVNRETLEVIDARQNRQLDAEIAVINEKGIGYNAFVTRKVFPEFNDDVKGYVTTDELAEVIQRVKSFVVA